ncbi:integrase core domain protein, partial [Trichuris suis]
LPLSKTKKVNVLTVQDYFTKWLVVRPIPDQTAETTVASLLQIFADFGPPSILHSDQGRNFESLLLEELCSAFGIRKTRCSPYHPEGNGLVERGNRTVIQILRAMATEGHDWEEVLPYAVYAYNTSIHSVTGYLPKELMFARPSTCIQSRSDPEPSGHAVDDYYNVLKRRMTQNIQEARRRLQEAAIRQKAYLDATARISEPLSPGTPVFVKRELGHKLQPKWQSGWVVVQQPDSSMVRVKHRDGTEKVLNLIKVKPCRPRAIQTAPLENTHVPADLLHVIGAPARTHRHRRPPVRTTPYHPKTNGLAERAVRTFKERLAKAGEASEMELCLQRFLFSYRNTPHATTGRSPAELLFGRRLRNQLDLLKPSLESTVDIRTFKQAVYHDRKARPRVFQPGKKCLCPSIEVDHKKKVSS